jgi:hypothetical protein
MLCVAGKEKWLGLDSSVLEVAKAKHDKEKSAIAKAKKWFPIIDQEQSARRFSGMTCRFFCNPVKDAFLPC